jgi:hypothetical protein
MPDETNSDKRRPDTGTGRCARCGERNTFPGDPLPPCSKCNGRLCERCCDAAVAARRAGKASGENDGNSCEISAVNNEKGCIFMHTTLRIGPSYIPTAGMGDFPQSERGKGSPYALSQPPLPMLSTIESVPLERPECAPALDDPDAGIWFIAFTKSNRHYDFVRLAARDGIEYFLPLAEKTTRVSNGKQTVTQYPLFGAYAFFRGDKYTPSTALATQMLRQVIPVVDQDRLRRDLANLGTALSAPRGRRIERTDLAVTGRKVRVADGAFEGVYGTVAGRRGNSDLLLIQVEGMMGGAVMEIDAAKLEPVD